MKTSPKKYSILIALLSVFCFSPTRDAFAQASPHFQTEQEAQEHCPQDIVVWVNTRSGVYHFKGQRWYGNTNSGAYECRKEADKEGDRETANGQ